MPLFGGVLHQKRMHLRHRGQKRDAFGQRRIKLRRGKARLEPDRRAPDRRRRDHRCQPEDMGDRQDAIDQVVR